MRYGVEHPIIPANRFRTTRLRGLSGLLGLVASELLLSLGLDGELGTADGRDTLDSELTEVGAVAVLGSLVGDGLVAPGNMVSIMLRASHDSIERRRVVLTCGWTWRRCAQT